MDTQKSSPLFRLFPSLTDLAFLMPAIVLFVKFDGARTLLGDGDTGWHVRIGQWMLAHHRIPRADFFSFTKPGQPFYAWEWLWDLSFGWLQQRWGMAAVVLLSLFILCLTFALLYRLALRKCPNVILAFAVTVIAMCASSVHWLARPHLVTLLFLVLLLGVLERERRSATRALYAVPFLMVLWTNLHGGFLAGLMVLGTYTIGVLGEALIAPADSARRAKLVEARRLAFTLAASIAATFVNPYFYELHTHIYAYLTDSYALNHINEFQTMSFHPPMAVFFEILMVLGAVAAFWHAGRRNCVYPLLLALWTHLALVAGRNIAVFAVVAVVPVTVMLDEIVAAVASADVAAWLRAAAAGFRAFASETGDTDRIPRLHAAPAVAFLLLAALFYAPHPPSDLQADYDTRRYPAKAIEYLRGPQFRSSIFTHDEWGDYLIYKMYPGGTKVFVDGRSDFYGPKFGQAYIDVLDLKWGWEKTLKRYGVNTILMPPDTALAGALKESKDWKVVYDDTVAVIFVSASQPALAENPIWARASRDVSTSFAAAGGGKSVKRRTT